MKVKKDKLSSSLSSKKRFNIDCENEAQLLEVIYFLLNSFKKENIYFRVNLNHKHLFEQENEPLIMIGNDVIFVCKDLSFLEILKNNLNGFHYMFIYLLDISLSNVCKKDIEKQLFVSSFDISIDQDLSCDFGVRYDDYGIEIARQKLEQLILE